MDACMHKNGMMMVKPVREQIVRYVETSGTADQLRAFEQQAAEAGLTALRQSKRRENVDMMKVMEEATQLLGEQKTEYAKGVAQRFMLDFAEGDEATEKFGAEGEAIVQGNLDEQESIIQDSIRRNTTYKAKYKLTGWNINIKFHPIAQHYWICDPTVPEMRDQPFCGYYDPMSIQEAAKLYPGIQGDLDNFRQFA